MEAQVDRTMRKMARQVRGFVACYHKTNNREYLKDGQKVVLEMIKIHGCIDRYLDADVIELFTQEV